MFERVSTFALHNSLRSSVRMTQNDLSHAQKEVATGRHADVGLKLGMSVQRNLVWRGNISSLQLSVDRNARLDERAAVALSSINAMNDAASELMRLLPGARSSENGKEIANDGAKQALSSTVGALQTSFAGVYLFSGQSPDTPPLANYEGSSAQTAFDAAFQAEFGFAKTDSLAVNITPAQLKQFLDGAFTNLFQDPAWGTNWSAVPAGALASELAPGTHVNLSANAGEKPFRDLLWAATAMIELSGTAINKSAFETLTDASLSKVAISTQGLGEIQSRIGFARQTVQSTGARMQSQMAIVEKAVASTEGVDPYAAATRLNSLSTQLEASYAVTARISRLSIMNHL
jgi:flagellar hook-associated protein 3 FlgL